MTSTRRRVVVTGMSIDSCVGSDLESFWKHLAGGVSGIRPIRSFDASDLPAGIAGEVDFRPDEYLSEALIRRTTRFQQLLLCNLHRLPDRAAALRDPERTALVVGTASGAIPFIDDMVAAYVRGGWRAMERMSVLKCGPNMAAALSALELGILGPVLTISTACASSTDAIGEAYRLVRDGDVDVAIGAGVEAWVTELSLAGFWLLRAFSRRGADEAERASRPFDRDRDGMVPAEGAASLILEEAGAAQAAGRPILAEIIGSGSSCDGYHLVKPSPDGSGAARAIRAALASAEISPEQVDHVNVHGTSTLLNDVVETRALKLALGDRAYQIPMTALKSMIGHASGACGAIETVATVLSLCNQYAPPTINLERPDPDCDLDYTPLKGRSAEMEVALKTNFGFGGQNSALVLRRWND